MTGFMSGSRNSPLSVSSVCSRCLFRLARTSFPAARRRTLSTNASSTPLDGSDAGQRPGPEGYFLANGFLRSKPKSRFSRVSRFGLPFRRVSATEGNGGATTTIRSVSQDTQLPSESIAEEVLPAQELPHRRRQRLKPAVLSSISPTTPGASSDISSMNPSDPTIPLDASSQLSTLSSTLPTRSLRRLLTTYLSLSKPRLSFLIVLTTTTAYSLYPVPDLLMPSALETPSLSPLTLLYLTTGTALSTASANALNMLFEPAHDAKMSRTRNRPLVRKLISPTGAALFALGTGLTGLLALYYGVNPTVCFLSGLNIFLYAGVYTPLKRVSVLNTWVGAVVGGIPPLMGWVAAAGQYTSSVSSSSYSWPTLLFAPDGSSTGGWLLSALLFTWQFPHFNALSHSIRTEYAVAGYRMLAAVNPARNARVALRYALCVFPICAGLCSVGVTDWTFFYASAGVNAWLVREAGRFWWWEGGRGSARALFWASVWHLPGVMVLAMVFKRGLWERVRRGVLGWGDDGLEEDDDVDDDEREEMEGGGTGRL
ncbi:MAG: Protoheme IX farnesyltransferase, mitochondrial [Caeruleum heppii]|nr:MAG: Protoheme IX farnesyltransferase, mitochondrial [Caeruleum heppii]